MQLRLTTILFAAMTLLQGLGISARAARTTTGSISANHEGNAFAAVFEIFVDGMPEIYYYASPLPAGTPQFVSTSAQMIFDNTSQLVGTEYIVEGTVGQGQIELVLTGPGVTKGPTIRGTIRQDFETVGLSTVKHGFWNNFPVEFY